MKSYPIRWSLKEQTTIKDMWKELQKRTHYSDREMWKHFPDLYNEMEKEELENISIRCARSIRKNILKHNKARLVECTK